VNKRRRTILSALEPVVAFAMEHQSPARPLAEVPGLTMRARPTAEAAGELLIFGRIGGGGWFMDGIGAADVATALKELGPGPINVSVNSGGGDVFDGVAIHSLLSAHPGFITTENVGVAASAASFIMLAGDKVKTRRNAMTMMHDAMTGIFGAKARLLRAVDLLDKVSDNIADMYAEKAGEDVAYWRAKMEENGEDGVWYTGQEAYDAGLYDEITGADDEDENVDDYLAGWVNMLPAEVVARIENRKPIVDDDKTPDPPAPVIDVAALKNIMKEVFA
jgi:ATP-dependent protease ClpP protease subunit